MAIKLMNLRHVPDDELDEILLLLDEHDIHCYQTTAGMFGISLPALWLRDDGQYAEARVLLDGYAERRASEARRRWQQDVEAGRPRTLLDVWRERPLRTSFYLALVAALVYLSTVPWFARGMLS